MSTETPRNFLAYEADFKKETGLEVMVNMSDYIAYCNYRQLSLLKGSMAVCTNHIVEEIRRLKSITK